MNPFENIFSLSGKTALVAGEPMASVWPSPGPFFRRGAPPFLPRVPWTKLEAHARELPRARALHLDFTSSDSIRAAAESAGPVDILVNVAGTNIRKRFEQYTREEYDRILQTNLHGIFELTQLVGAKMVARGAGGKIINIGSLMSVLGLPYITVYAITKGAIGQFTKSLAAEWGQHNIQVNCIAPASS